ncbi:MAG TPA: sensor domain-containing diguanylate cyclase [Nitrospirae bacterium]|nr:sensor domain-containing diguanylate cyclase [Nitrospirota bacterium]
MIQHFLDIPFITKALEAFSAFTELQYSLFDDRGNTIISSPEDNTLLSYVKRDKKGQALYREFVEKNLRFALKRKDHFMVKGPAQQYHIFIPVQYKEIKMLLLAEAFYTSVDDFEAYCTDHETCYSVGNFNKEEWFREVIFMPMEKAEVVANHIRQLIDDVMAVGYENKLSNKRWLWSKTMINLVANIKSSAPVDEIFESIVEAIVFLFDVDTAGILTSDNGCFRTRVSGGRNSNEVRNMKLSDKSYYVQKSKSTHSPVVISDSRMLWSSGLPEEILSLHLFPMASETDFIGFICIFNSLLDRETFNSIYELSKLSTYICNTHYISDEMQKKSDKINDMSSRIMELYADHRNPLMLFEKIVNEAAGIVNADKCSLMLPDRNGEKLVITAVTGVNRVLLKDIHVKKGEGIAGKAYESRSAILIDKEAGFSEYHGAPRSFFKTVSCLSLPLSINGDVVGVLNISDKTSGESFSENDIVKLNPFAQQASLLIKLSNYYSSSEEMRELSITDPLTNLYNRRYFDIHLEEEFKRSERYDLGFSLAIIDIDDFKLFNDSEGHLAGDQVLKEISFIMMETLRSNDILVRFGGEEFAVIMPQTSHNDAYNVAERIRINIKEQAIRAMKTYPGDHITVSIGIAMYPEAGDKVENIIKYADRALYKAKMQGKDQTQVWHDYARG